VNGKKDRVVEWAFLVSLLISSIWFLCLAWPFLASGASPTDIPQILTLNLQVNAVLFGFSSTLIIYVLQRFATMIPKWAHCFALTVLISYFMSMLFGFICIFGAKNLYPVYALIPVSFTLTGILATIAFLNLAVVKISERQQKV
jgi:hypothetical protein